MSPDRFEIDLTSVCVRRGAVQLPFRLKDAFSEGSVTAVDADGGSVLELAFHAPRELAGLAPFFEAHALRANDSVGLVFAEQGLQLQAIRRERGSARAGAKRAVGASPGAADRARPAPPSTASPGSAPGASEPASSPASGDDSASHSAASPTPPSLRMEVPRASVPAGESDRPASGSGAGDRTPRWEPLDVTAATAEGAPSGASARPADEPATGRVIVREVRRSRPPGEGAQSAARSPADEAQAVSAPREEASPPHEEASPPTGGVPPDPDRAERGPGLFGLARRFGRGRGEGGGAPRRGGRSEAGAAGSRPRAPREAVSDYRQAPLWPAGGGPDDVARYGAAGGGPVGSAGAAPTSEEDRGGSGEAVPAPSAAQRASHADTVTAVDEEAWEPEAGRRDIGAVRSYLAGPDVPAIVRTERVAEALGLSVVRVERALERVSEESDELSRIRGGAYMLRRPGKG